MAALGGREEGRKEKTEALRPPPGRTAQRRWSNLTEEVEKTQQKNIFSQEGEESFSGTVEFWIIFS
jgi:hypothetical protein